MLGRQGLCYTNVLLGHAVRPTHARNLCLRSRVSDRHGYLSNNSPLYSSWTLPFVQGSWCTWVAWSSKGRSSRRPVYCPSALSRSSVGCSSPAPGVALCPRCCFLPLYSRPQWDPFFCCLRVTASVAVFHSGQWFPGWCILSYCILGIGATGWSGGWDLLAVAGAGESLLRQSWSEVVFIANWFTTVIATKYNRWGLRGGCSCSRVPFDRCPTVTPAV
jgi:hypothetical protein